MIMVYYHTNFGERIMWSSQIQNMLMRILYYNWEHYSGSVAGNADGGVFVYQKNHDN